MPIRVFDLGLVEFKKAWDFQKGVFQAVKRRDFSFGLILCRHYPVITIGRAGSRNNIWLDDGQLRSKGIDLYEIERGGDVTYHGPGQLTAYPVFDLHYLKKDINLFLRNLEQAIIDLLWDFAIMGVRVRGSTGVWIEEKGERQKIASIGIAVKNWITFHGLTFNVKKDDLDNFSLIRPCGMDIRMTSLESLLGTDMDMEDITQRLGNIFKEEQNDQSCVAGIRRRY
ncbi:MAG: lipoyl(octanoyl) transferase LipB [Candidatus Omnitrophota bacterium]